MCLVLLLLFVFVSSTLFILPLSLRAFLVLVSCTILILDSACSETLLALVHLKLYLCAVVEIRLRILRKDDVLASNIEASFLGFSISRDCHTHELDLLVRNDKPKPILACKELNGTRVNGFFVDFPVVSLARNFL